MAQIAAPQSLHVATALLLHGDPTSLSLRPCSIWQLGLISPCKSKSRLHRQLQLSGCNKKSANPYCQSRLGFFRHLVASTRRTSSAWLGNSRRFIQLRQLNEQFTDAFARLFELLKFSGRRIALLVKLRLQSNQSAQFCTDLHFVGYIHDATSVQARS